MGSEWLLKHFQIESFYIIQELFLKVVFNAVKLTFL